jgi:hypothetical protein
MKMIDLRFVEREVPDWPRDIVIGQPCKMKTVKILQWRQVSNLLEVANELQPPIWTEWEDVPTEK